MTTIDCYQNAVRQLTAENKRLREELAAAKKAHQAETRKLRAQRDEGLSPELAVLRRELLTWRWRAQAAEARLATVKRAAG